MLFVLSRILSLQADVEIVAGSQESGLIFEPFSVDFDSRGILHGVEFTKANRVFRLVDGRVEFIEGMMHNGKDRERNPGIHDGTDPLQAVFCGMHDLQITSDDIAIIADSFHHRVRRFDLATGAVSTLAGSSKKGFSGDGGPANESGFNVTMTACLSPDEERIYIADIGNHRT